MVVLLQLEGGQQPRRTKHAATCRIWDGLDAPLTADKEADPARLLDDSVAVGCGQSSSSPLCTPLYCIFGVGYLLSLAMVGYRVFGGC